MNKWSEARPPRGLCKFHHKEEERDKDSLFLFLFRLKTYNIFQSYYKLLIRHPFRFTFLGKGGEQKKETEGREMWEENGLSQGSRAPSLSFPLSLGGGTNFCLGSFINFKKKKKIFSTYNLLIEELTSLYLLLCAVVRVRAWLKTEITLRVSLIHYLNTSCS